MLYISQWDEQIGREGCGEASVKMALSDSGIAPTLLEMKNLSDPEMNGTTAADLQGLFAHYGVKSYYYSGKELPPAPAILLFRYGALSRSDVQDVNFTGLHWFVFLGIDDDHAIFNDPDWGLWGLRRSEGENKRYKLAEVMAGFAGEAITWENNVSTIPIKGIVKSDIETEPKFLRVRDGVNSTTIIGAVPDGATVYITGQATDTKNRLWYKVMFPMTSPILFSDEKLTMPLTYNMEGWCAGWLIDTGAPADPTFSISVLPATITAGQSAVVSMSFQNVGGAWLNGQALDGSRQPVLLTVNPVDTTVYTLKVKTGDTYQEKSVTLAVKPVPPPPIKKVLIGFNALNDGGAAKDAYNAGCRMFTMMNDTDTANWLAQQPNTVVLYRQWWNHAPSEDEAFNALSVPRLHPLVIRIGINECEYIDGNDFRSHASFDIHVAQRLRAQDERVHYAAGTYSMGTPDFTQQWICDAIRQYYAPSFNNGLIDWDHHLYSPNTGWIYKGMPGQALIASGSTKLVRGPVGRDGHRAVWVDDRIINEHTFLRDGITPFADAPMFADSPTFQDWYETRWHFLYTRCGFDVNSTSRIYGTEWGVDEGGVGGFSAHNASDQDVVAYCKRLIQIQSALVNGRPSPFVGGCFFQLGNTQGRWDGYDMRKYLAAMKAAGLFT